MCHGERGVGGTCPTLVRGLWAPGGPDCAAFMLKTIIQGRPGTEMPAWESVLKPSGIQKIVSYLRHESTVIATQDIQYSKSTRYERRP